MKKIITTVVLCAVLSSPVYLPVYGDKKLSANLVKVIRTMTLHEAIEIKELYFSRFRDMNKWLNKKTAPSTVNPIGRMDEAGFNELKNLTDYQITAIIHMLHGELTATDKLDEDEVVHVVRRLKYDNIEAFRSLSTYNQVDAIRQLTYDDFIDLEELTDEEIEELQKE